MNHKNDDEPSQPIIGAAARRRVVAKIERCIGLVLDGIERRQRDRHHRRCGRTTCARSRRCRGFACDHLIAPR